MMIEAQIALAAFALALPCAALGDVLGFARFMAVMVVALVEAEVSLRA